MTDPFPPRIFEDRQCVDGVHIFCLSKFGTTCECGKAPYRLALTTGGVDLVMKEPDRPRPFTLAHGVRIENA